MKSINALWSKIIRLNEHGTNNGKHIFSNGSSRYAFFASSFKSGCCSVVAALRKSVKCRSVTRERCFDLIGPMVEKELSHTM